MNFGDKLKKLRIENGLTQDELAELLFVSRTAISKWESCRGFPNIESLKAISKYFSITLDDLLSNDELITFAEQDQKEKEQHILGRKTIKRKGKSIKSDRKATNRKKLKSQNLKTQKKKNI